MNREKAELVAKSGRLWEQLKGEGVKPFAAFTLYLSLGPERTLEKVAQRLNRSMALLGGWSRRWHWQRRIAAYHEHLAEIQRKAIEAQAVVKAVEWAKVEEALKREWWDKGEKLAALAERIIAKYAEKDAMMGGEALARILELSAKLKARAAGLSFETVKVEGEVRQTLDVSWEQALKRVYGPAANPAPPPVVVDVEAKMVAALGEGGGA